MPDPSDHRSTVREAFTKQASAYASNEDISDTERIERLISVADPSPDARVLEVATGPGYVALEFASFCEQAVGIDLTREPLSIAERTRQERDVSNVHFVQGDAGFLPMRDGQFDVIVCRFAFHHLEEPDSVLREMVRVCDPDGTVVVEDLVVSEHPERGQYQNRFERLRDPSHVRAYPLSGLLKMFAGTGLEVEATHTDAIVQEVDDWLENAQTPEQPAAEARSMIERDLEEDLSGARPFRRNDTLCFVHRTAIVAGHPVTI